MSRRRHNPEGIALAAGRALELVMRATPFCPVCRGASEGVHRGDCLVARALREYVEWRSIEGRQSADARAQRLGARQLVERDRDGVRASPRLFG